MRFKEVSNTGKLYSSEHNQSFSAPSNKIEKDILTLTLMAFHAIRGSDAKKMSLWKR